jgi:drug/metabolite transporter superfamily protein YnfA
MQLSRESKIVCGILLIAVPSIMYGGVTILGLLTEGTAGLVPGSLVLNETQRSLWRAGHAHAGVFVVLSLILQPLVDQTAFSNSVKWMARIGAPAASILLPAGFFGLAFIPGFKWLVYLGVVCLAISMLLTGIGLLKNLRSNVT